MPLVLVSADSIHEERGWELGINMQKSRDNNSDARDRKRRESDRSKVVMSLLAICSVISAAMTPARDGLSPVPQVRMNLFSLLRLLGSDNLINCL